MKLNSDLIRRLKPFAVMPLAVLSDCRLEAADKIILSALWSYAGESNEVWPKHEAISERVGGAHRGTIIRSLERLRAAGWITWTRGKYGNRYILNPVPAEDVRCSNDATSEDVSRCSTDATSDGARCSSDATSEGNPDVANMESRCCMDATSDVANRVLHIRKNQIQEPTIEPSSSSSRGVAPSVRKDEDEDLQPFIQFLASVLRSKTNQAIPVSRTDALRARAKAPDWTLAEITEALREYASTGKPQSVQWFPVTIADVYERLEGKPPALSKRCAHGVLEGDACESCRKEAEGQRRAEKDVQDAELEARGICAHCRNGGRVKHHMGWEDFCGKCETGRMMKAADGQERAVSLAQSDRFQILRRSSLLALGKELSWELELAFSCWTADLREECLAALECDCSIETARRLLKVERKTA